MITIPESHHHRPPSSSSYPSQPPRRRRRRPSSLVIGLNTATGLSTTALTITTPASSNEDLTPTCPRCDHTSISRAGLVGPS
nr:unnamed protein product [Spirometra erinaceieuropaei]